MHYIIYKDFDGFNIHLLHKTNQYYCYYDYGAAKCKLEEIKSEIEHILTHGVLSRNRVWIFLREEVYTPVSSHERQRLKRILETIDIISTCSVACEHVFNTVN